MNIIANAFSLQMLGGSDDTLVSITTIGVDDVKSLLADGFISAVGHPDTAAVVSGLLGIDVPSNRINIKLGGDDTLIVAQLTGGRLPVGATTLPDGFDIKFMKVTLV